MRTSEEYDQRVLAFFQKYKDPETQKQFEKLVALTRSNCEKLLENIALRGVVQGRVKKPDSLKEKLKVPDVNLGPDENLHRNSDDAEADEADAEPEEADADIYENNGEVADIRDWIRKGQNIYKHPEIGDFAGVRIGLFFPDDVEKVAVEVEKHFRKKHRWGTVKEGRKAPEGRNLDPQRHLMMGAWVSPNTNDQWEHYGYKSWQVVVQWKKNPLEPLESDALRDSLKLLREEMPKGFKSLRFEIQVGTVVTQAWAEVQHNIIYKNADNILTSTTMKRMIDATNGLAITTDIMLRELRESVEKAKHEVSKQEQENFERIQEKISQLAFRSRVLDTDGPLADRFQVPRQIFDRAWGEVDDLLSRTARTTGAVSYLANTDYNKQSEMLQILERLIPILEEIGSYKDDVEYARDYPRNPRRRKVPTMARLKKEEDDLVAAFERLLNAYKNATPI